MTRGNGLGKVFGDSTQNRCPITKRTVAAPCAVARVVVGAARPGSASRKDSGVLGRARLDTHPTGGHSPASCHYQDQRDPGEEPADVRHIRDTRGLAGRGADLSEELQCDPGHRRQRRRKRGTPGAAHRLGSARQPSGRTHCRPSPSARQPPGSSPSVRIAQCRGIAWPDLPTPGRSGDPARDGSTRAESLAERVWW